MPRPDAILLWDRHHPGDIGWARLWLDGVEVTGIRTIVLEHEANKFPVIRLELIPNSIRTVGLEETGKERVTGQGEVAP